MYSFALLLLLSSTVYAVSPIDGICLSQHVLNDQVLLRKEIKKPCVQSWVQNETTKTLEKLRQDPLNKEIASIRKSFIYSGQSLPYSTALGNIEINSKGLALITAAGEQVLAQHDASSKIDNFKLSPDLKKIAVSYASSVDPDIKTWKFYNLDSKTWFDESISLRIWDLNWDADSKGVFYNFNSDLKTEQHLVNINSRYRPSGVYYHNLGSPVQTDQYLFEDIYSVTSIKYQIYEMGTEKALFAFTKTGYLQRLSMYSGKRRGSIVDWQTISTPSSDNYGQDIGRDGDSAYFISSSAGNNFGVVSINPLKSFDPKVVIPARPNIVIENARVQSGKIFVTSYDNNYNPTFEVYNIRGDLLKSINRKTLGLPESGGGRFSFNLGHTSALKYYFSFSAMNVYPINYEMSVENLDIKLMPNQQPQPDYLTQIESLFLSYESFDGEKIPVQIFYDKNLKEFNFANVSFYGNNGMHNLQAYSPRGLTLLKMGGILVVPGVRGGGELGINGYKQTFDKRWITITDTAYASRWLKTKFKIKNDSVFASGQSSGGTNTYILAQTYPQDFSGFSVGATVSDFENALNGNSGWLSIETLNFKRADDGEFIDYEKQLQATRNWSPAEQVNKMTAVKPMLTIGIQNDLRTGPWESWFLPLAISNKFGDLSNQHLMMLPEGGHNYSGGINEELTFMVLLSK